MVVGNAAMRLIVIALLKAALGSAYRMEAVSDVRLKDVGGAPKVSQGSV